MTELPDTSAGPYARIVLARVPGASYDYRAQVWRDHHDHYHVGIVRAGEGVPTRGFCGADVDTCQGVSR